MLLKKQALLIRLSGVRSPHRPQINEAWRAMRWTLNETKSRNTELAPTILR
jgi:hypothetical protein